MTAAHPNAKYPELQDPAWLRARYVEDGLSLDGIAELVDFDCSAVTVGYWMRKHGIPARPRTSRAPAGRSVWTEGRAAASTVRGCGRMMEGA